MTITVTTGGPADEAPEDTATRSTVLSPPYGALLSDIADDIDDTTGEYRDSTKTAILAAIRYCERFKYYFNETRDITFPTVQGQEWYGGSDNINIQTLVHIANVWCEVAGQRFQLGRVRPQDIEFLASNSATQGQPVAWDYFNQQIRLYPVPGPTVYTIRLQLSAYRLTALADEADSNVWLGEAYDMVKARAKYILAKDTLKDANLAAEALSDYNDQHAALMRETSARNGTGFIKVTCF
jgi:hypothetical protein